MKMTPVILSVATLLFGSGATAEPIEGAIPVSLTAPQAPALSPADTRTVRICVARFWDAEVSMCIEPTALRMSKEAADAYARAGLARVAYSGVAYLAEVCRPMPGDFAMPRSIEDRRRYCERREQK